MGLFDSIGNSIKSGVHWLGEKASQASKFIGDKVQTALPKIGDIAETVSNVANKVAGYMPIGGGLAKAVADSAQWVSDKVRDGTANNALEATKKGLNVFSDEIKKLK